MRCLRRLQDRTRSASSLRDATSCVMSVVHEAWEARVPLYGAVSNPTSSAVKVAGRLLKTLSILQRFATTGCFLEAASFFRDVTSRVLLENYESRCNQA